MEKTKFMELIMEEFLWSESGNIVGGGAWSYTNCRVPKCQILCAGGFDCSIIAQKMYESQQTNFAIK